MMMRPLSKSIACAWAVLAVTSAMSALVGCGGAADTRLADADSGTATEAAADAPEHEAAPADTEAPVASPNPNVRERHTSFYRLSLNGSDDAATMPPVLLTKKHESLCRVQVGDTMPAIELQQVDGGRKRLGDLYGHRATVVVFWRSDRRMARAELADLGPDVAEPLGSDGVAVVGIAVRESVNQARSALRQARVTFPNLIDADGSAFAKVGADKLPRTYLLDSSGKVLWFDIEYSLATRRELAQALAAAVRQEP